ncbi:signal peptidase I [Leifsonia sp. 563]|uniref:signal peptidase I n=1 Tax=Leifsonia sp. 563 TaxID=3156412 RepID=UPI0033922E3D
MTVMPRIPSRRSKQRRSSYVPPANRSSVVPDALSWREQNDTTTAPKGPAAWTAASITESDRTVIDAGPYGVIDLAVMEAGGDFHGRNQQLGVVWWDKRSFREEDDDFGTIQTSFVPASITDHVSLAPPQSRTATPAPHDPRHADAQVQTPGAAPLPPEGAPLPAAAPAAAHISVAPAAPAVPAAPATHAPAPATTRQPSEDPRVAEPRPTSRRANRHAAAPAQAAPAQAGPDVTAPPMPTAETQAFAPPVSASNPVALDDSEHQRHARRSRHVALVPKTRGRRGRLADSRHPRRAMLRRRRTRRRVILGTLLVVVAFAVTILVQNIIVTPFTVPSVSMENTLHTDDRILVNKLAYGAAPISRGDVIVFSDPGGWLDGSPSASASAAGAAAAGTGDYLVKRVIGIPGDKVSCCSTNGHVTVNGVELYEPYAVIPEGQPASAEFDVTVPAGELWVLGDNRYNSRDSSHTQDLPTKGFVPIVDVVGQAALKLWPLNQFAPISSARETFASVPNQTCPI